VLFYERLLASVIGAASARVLVSAIVEEEALGVDELMSILDETSRVIEANRLLEDKSRALEAATADLRQANDRLTELDQLKDTFVATVNHELRTPLASIRAFSEILRDHPDLPGGQRDEFLSIVVTETERLTRLINQLLDLSKIEATGALPAAVAPTDLVEVARESAAATQQLFSARNVRLRTKIEVDHAFVLGDHDRLVQVLINLLGNAAKFAPAGRGMAELSLRQRGEQYEIAVADNGPGISPADRQSVFERFRQLGDTMTAKPEGAGLGLAISQSIVAQHGSRIRIDDTEGGGARFSIDLKPTSQPAETPSLAPVV
jgi:signal transduction histidine kinase